MALVLRGFGGIVVMVTNPVDLMSRLFAEVSGIPRVVGIVSNLDSARYRLLTVPPHTVAGSVIGEHSDTLVVCASSTTVNGEAVRVPVDQVRAALLARSGQISRGIGRTRSGPAGAVLSTLRLLLGLADGVEELCRPYRRGWAHITTPRILSKIKLLVWVTQTPDSEPVGPLGQPVPTLATRGWVARLDESSGGGVRLVIGGPGAQPVDVGVMLGRTCSRDMARTCCAR